MQLYIANHDRSATKLYVKIDRGAQQSPWLWREPIADI